MTKILENPPKAIQNDLELLKADLDIKIPSKKLDKNLLIASWNIRAFGNLTRKWISESDDSPKRDLQSVLCIAEILKRFDVIAVQEVKSNIRALRDTLKLLGDDWSLILTDVTKGDSGNGERMAYIFDTRRVKLSGLAGELVIPNEWTKGIVKPIPKAGSKDPREPLNYRGISLLCVPYKIYADILNHRLSKWLETNDILADEQNGFRRKRSCQEHIYTLYTSINNRKLSRQSTYSCFVDLSKAYDSIQRDCLWYKIMAVGVNI